MENPGEVINNSNTEDVTATCQESHRASDHGDLSLHSVLYIPIDPVKGGGIEVDLDQLERLVVLGPG